MSRKLRVRTYTGRTSSTDAPPHRGSAFTVGVRRWKVHSAVRRPAFTRASGTTLDFNFRKEVCYRRIRSVSQLNISVGKSFKPRGKTLRGGAVCAAPFRCFVSSFSRRGTPSRRAVRGEPRAVRPLPSPRRSTARRRSAPRISRRPRAGRLSRSSRPRG